MELRHLRAFLAVAEEKSFTRAAARLYLTQPALSHQIRDLERSVGGPLFERSARWVRTTPAGLALIDLAHKTLDAASEAMAVARQQARCDAGRLSVGLFYGAAGDLTQPILAAYHERFPDVEVTVCRPDHSTMHTAVLDGDLDVAFVRPPVVSAQLARTDLFEEPRALAVSLRHSLADADRVPVHEILDLPVARTPDWVPAPWISFWTFDAHRDGKAPPRADGVAHTVEEYLQMTAEGQVVMPTASGMARCRHGHAVHLLHVTKTPRSAVSLVARCGDRRDTVQGFFDTARLVTQRLCWLVPNATACAQNPNTG